MRYDFTLLRFMLLTSQDQDERGTDAANWLSEISHWFDTQTVESHEQLLCDSRLMTPPEATGAGRRPHLTRVGSRVANYLRDERDWRYDITVNGDISESEFRGRVARALRRKRRRSRTPVPVGSSDMGVRQYWSL